MPNEKIVTLIMCLLLCLIFCLASAEAALDATPGFELMLPENDAAFQSMDLSLNMDDAIHRAETATLEDGE